MPKRLVVMLVVLAARAGTARAEDKKAADTGAPRNAKVYEFSGDTIEGELPVPDGLMFGIPRGPAYVPLIRIRRDFIAEIIKLSEDL